MPADVSNVFVQTEIPGKLKGERMIIKIIGILAQILCEIAPETYLPFIVYENN